MPSLSADSPQAYSIVSFEFRDFPKWILLSKDQNIVPSNGSRLLIIKMDLEASHLDPNPKHCPRCTQESLHYTGMENPWAWPGPTFRSSVVVRSQRLKPDSPGSNSLLPITPVQTGTSYLSCFSYLSCNTGLKTFPTS